jgi:hypothetical protein
MWWGAYGLGWQERKKRGGAFFAFFAFLPAFSTKKHRFSIDF